MKIFNENTTNHRRAFMFIAAALFGGFTAVVFYQVSFTVQEFIFPGLVGLLVFELLLRTRHWLSLKTLPLYILAFFLPIHLLYSLLYSLLYFQMWNPIESLQYLFSFPYILYLFIETSVVTGFAYYLVKVYRNESWNIQENLPSSGESGNEPIFAAGQGPADPAPQKTNYAQAAVGFILWFIIASILAPGSLGLITTPLTIIALIAFGRSQGQKSVAAGILAAVSLNFIVSLIQGMTFNAWCFMPFYVESF